MSSTLLASSPASSSLPASLAVSFTVLDSFSVLVSSVLASLIISSLLASSLALAPGAPWMAEQEQPEQAEVERSTSPEVEVDSEVALDSTGLFVEVDSEGTSEGDGLGGVSSSHDDDILWKKVWLEKLSKLLVVFTVLFVQCV